MRRLALVTLMALLSVCVACGGSGDDVATGPSSTGPTAATETVPPTIDEAFPVGTFGAGWSSVGAGIGYLDLDPDGTGRLRGMPMRELVDVTFTYAVDGDRLTMTAPMPTCESSTATYRWSLREHALHLGVLDDGCEDRALVLTEIDWYPLGDVPVVASEPTEDQPITVASPVGEIRWHVLEGFSVLAPAVAFGDGFAVLVGVGDDAVVMTSPDGFVWTPIPSPPTAPTELRLLDVRGDELYVAAGEHATDVYVTADLGATWTPIPIDAPPSDGAAAILRAGPAGVVLVMFLPPDEPDRIRSATWVLGADSFQPVPSAPSSMRRVLALDHGFVGSSFDGRTDDPATTWTSGDGREWVESVDAPDGLFLQSARGDAVYGSAAIDRGVTSTDGGRTWSAPVERPGEPYAPFTVGDDGAFAVQVAVFAPAVGVVWASADQVTWERVLNPWPPPYLAEPVLNGDTMLITSEIHDEQGRSVGELNWVGIIG
ncbi:MAG: hypothetical protein S0880_05610 [Actinomycetota bacterium]|nr:hypothetical protein [Actinomycetota bacterium]